MPNYCSNYIRIKGNHDFIKSFQQACKLPDSNNESCPFSFNQTVPIPSDQTELNALMNKKNINILSWGTPEIILWGSKWDAVDPNVIYGLNQIFIQCETAWSPPIAWAKNYFNSLPPEYQLNGEILIAYCEFGIGFYGTFLISCNGVNQQTHDIIDPMDFTYDEEKEKTLINTNSKLDNFLRKYCIRSLGG